MEKEEEEEAYEQKKNTGPRIEPCGTPQAMWLV